LVVRHHPQLGLPSEVGPRLALAYQVAVLLRGLVEVEPWNLAAVH